MALSRLLPISLAFLIGSLPLRLNAQAPSPVPTTRVEKKLTTAKPSPAPPAPRPSPAPASPPKAAPDPAPKPQMVPKAAPVARPPAAASAASASTASEGGAGSLESVAPGIVTIERGGRALALGVVLDGDGRILTALSPLTNGNFLQARYADGSLAALRVVHVDRGWDLALLTAGKNAKGDEVVKSRGLRAATLVDVRSARLLGVDAAHHVQATPIKLVAAPPLLGGDGRTVGDAYELGPSVTTLGAPIVNVDGEVIALAARGCTSGAGPQCTQVSFGVPVKALKGFLRRAPSNASWLGVEGVADQTAGVSGVRVAGITPGSLAEGLGLRAGASAATADLLVGVGGVHVLTPAELRDAVRGYAAGDDLELLVFGFGRYRVLPLKLRAGAANP